MQSRYSAANFPPNINKRHARAQLLLLWIQHLVDILPQLLQLLIQYLKCYIGPLYYGTRLYIRKTAYTLLQRGEFSRLWESRSKMAAFPLLVGSDHLIWRLNLESEVSISPCLKFADRARTLWDHEIRLRRKLAEHPPRNCVDFYFIIGGEALAIRTPLEQPCYTMGTQLVLYGLHAPRCPLSEKGH